MVLFFPEFFENSNVDITEQLTLNEERDGDGAIFLLDLELTGDNDGDIERLCPKKEDIEEDGVIFSLNVELVGENN